MKTAEQRARLIELRDVVIPNIPDDELDMRKVFGKRCCVLGHARQRFIPSTAQVDVFFGISYAEFKHMFSSLLPNDKADLMSRVTDVLEADL